jgi:hypothetical protein
VDVLRILQEVNETGFDDFTLSSLPDGTTAAKPEHLKV